jgi:DNA-binding XRE family transcriptional regulator
MTAADFMRWQRAMGFTGTKAAAALGVSRATVVDIRMGRRPVSGPIALACAAVAAGLGPWSDTSNPRSNMLSPLAVVDVGQ